MDYASSYESYDVGSSSHLDVSSRGLAGFITCVKYCELYWPFSRQFVFNEVKVHQKNGSTYLYHRFTLRDISDRGFKKGLFGMSIGVRWLTDHTRRAGLKVAVFDDIHLSRILVTVRTIRIKISTFEVKIPSTCRSRRIPRQKSWNNVLCYTAANIGKGSLLKTIKAHLERTQNRGKINTIATSLPCPNTGNKRVLTVTTQTWKMWIKGNNKRELVGKTKKKKLLKVELGNTGKACSAILENMENSVLCQSESKVLSTLSKVKPR